MKKRTEYFSPKQSPNRLFVRSIYIENEMPETPEDSYYAVIPNYEDASNGFATVLITEDHFYEIKHHFENDLLVFLQGLEYAEQGKDGIIVPKLESLLIEATT